MFLWVGVGGFSKVVATFNRVGGSFSLFMATTRGCLNNPIFSNLGLCAVCWAHFVCHHELQPTSVGHSFSFLNSSWKLLSLFLAATKQLYEWFSPSVCPSVRLSVRPSHLFDYVPIIVSSWNFQALVPVTKVTSMQKVTVRGQRSRSQRSTPNLAVSGP